VGLLRQLVVSDNSELRRRFDGRGLWRLFFAAVGKTCPYWEFSELADAGTSVVGLPLCELLGPRFRMNFFRKLLPNDDDRFSDGIVGRAVMSPSSSAIMLS
jgi:hypothetical protein